VGGVRRPPANDQLTRNLRLGGARPERKQRSYRADEDRIDSAAHFFIAVEANLSSILSSFLLDWSLRTLWRGRRLADTVAKVENRSTLKISQKPMFRRLYRCNAR
jgi:hypothetical protein